jgi:transcriptional regulator with XRE-family HTH domain
LTGRSTDLEAVAASIAGQVRGLRQGRGWSLDELASRSGVSKGMVVQIEGARTNPSIGTLCRIAEAFGVSIGRLIEATAEPVVRVIGADEVPTLWHGSAGGRAHLLRGVNDPAFVELWRWRLMPGEHQSADDHTPGTRELMHVHTGQLTVRVDQTPYLVRAAETIDFRADRPHEYRNDGTETVDLTMVVVMPPGGYDRARHTFDTTSAEPPSAEAATSAKQWPPERTEAATSAKQWPPERTEAPTSGKLWPRRGTSSSKVR